MGDPLAEILLRRTGATLIVMEGDALDDAGDLLGRGSALWHGGVHVEIHFATEGRGMGDPAGRVFWVAS